MFESEFNKCFLGIILILTCALCFSSSQEFVIPNAETIQKKILDFGSRLNRVIHWNNRFIQNVLFSPLNIYGALLLMHLGSDATTSEEIRNILGIVKADEEWPGVHEKFSKIFEFMTDIDKMETSQEYNLNASDVIFVDRLRLKKKFVKYVRSYYDCDIINVDFLNEGSEAVKIINNYIANRVGQHVRTLYKEPQTFYIKLILASCLNFNSRWQFPFRKSTTQRDIFYGEDGKISVDMMQRVGHMSYANISSLAAEIGKLWSSGNMSVFVVLPYKQLNLQYFVDNVVSDDFDLMVSSVVENHWVDFKLPRTTLKWAVNLDEFISHLRAKEIFTPQANFSNMINEEYFDVSEIKYVADVNITEYRIEASSVTSMKISSSNIFEPADDVASSKSDQPILELMESNEISSRDEEKRKFSNLQFYINRPFFIFVYHEEIKSVLFFGAVNNPNGI